MKNTFRAIALLTFAAFGAQANATNIEHVGAPRVNEVAPSSISMNSDIMAAARVLTPSGWTGFAQRNLNTRRISSVSVQSGEPWVAALDRWLQQENLSARLDWHSNRFYLNAGQAASASNGSWSPAPIGSVAQPAAPIESWEIDLKDIHLANTFARWGEKKGWTVLWDAPKNIMIEATSVFQGSLPDAIDQVLRSPGIANSAFPLEACVYPNTPPLVRITLKDEQKSECK